MKKKEPIILPCIVIIGDKVAKSSVIINPDDIIKPAIVIVDDKRLEPLKEKHKELWNKILDTGNLELYLKFAQYLTGLCHEEHLRLCLIEHDVMKYVINKIYEYLNSKGYKGVSTEEFYSKFKYVSLEDMDPDKVANNLFEDLNNIVEELVDIAENLYYDINEKFPRVSVDITVNINTFDKKYLSSFHKKLLNEEGFISISFRIIPFVGINIENTKIVKGYFVECFLFGHLTNFTCNFFKITSIL